MQNPWLARYAHLLTTYCLRMKPGQTYAIQAQSHHALPLVDALVRALAEQGVLPVPRFNYQQLEATLLKHGAEALQLGDPLERLVNEQFDGVISILSPTNAHWASSVPGERLSAWRRARLPAQKAFFERWAAGSFQWVLCTWPVEALAQQAGLSLEDYDEFVAKACFLHHDDPVAAWRALSHDQEAVAERLNGVQTLRYVGDGTDLTLSVAGRTWINADGHQANMPDGEVFTGPVEDSAQGTIRFTFPAIYQGREVEDVRLTFRDGQVVEWSVARGSEFFAQMLDTDPGARRIGEIAFGTNPCIQSFSRNMLFDEKMGGTIHLALGRSIDMTGGKNASAIHWDLLKDMHQGQVFADGVLIYEDGRFI